MARRIALAKAAQLLGISRHELQDLVARGELATFEGCVSCEELLQRYPHLKLRETSVILERLAALQETAFSRRVRETVLVDSESLTQRLQQRTAELAVQRVRAEKYSHLLYELSAEIAARHAHAEGETRACLESLSLWLLERLEDRCC